MKRVRGREGGVGREREGGEGSDRGREEEGGGSEGGREGEGGGSEGGREGEGGRGRKGEGRVWCGVIGRGETVVRGREGQEVVLGQLFLYMGALFLNVGGHFHMWVHCFHMQAVVFECGWLWALGAVSSSCDGGHGRCCHVVWSWCSGSAVVAGLSLFMVLGPHQREWVVVLGPRRCSLVVELGPHHHSLVMVLGPGAWWYGPLFSIRRWWYWALIAIHGWWCGASFTVHVWWCWVLVRRLWYWALITAHRWRCWVLVVHVVLPLSFVDGVAGCSLHYLWVVVVGPVMPFVGGTGALLRFSCAMVWVAPRHGPGCHSRVRVMGRCSCLWVLVIVHGCLWAVGSGRLLPFVPCLRWWLAAAFIFLVMWHCHVLLAVVVVGDGCVVAVDDGDEAMVAR